MPSAVITLQATTAIANLLKALRGDTIANVVVSRTYPYLYGSAGGGRGGNGCAYISIESDPDNGAAELYVGDGDVSATNCGKTLLAGDIDVKQAPTNIHGLGDLSIRTDTANAKAIIDWDYA